VSEPLRMVCAGCGTVVPAAEPYPFRCPAARAGDDIDHVLRRELPATPAGLGADRAGERNPLLRYRERLYSYQVARTGGLSDQQFVDLVGTLDRAIAAVDGHGLATTPLAAQPALAAWLGLDAGALWVKDETGNVSGSHKVRHLAGILVHLEVIDRLGRGRPRTTPLAIASCGNAALAAAVLARAADRPLQVSAPP
jgi:threonine synthase